MMTMIDPWKLAEAEMLMAGFDLNRVPKYEYDKHLWADGILFYWTQHHELPNAHQLAEEMFDEWDDPVSVDEAEQILSLVKAQV
jgi:hypothetical protein